MAFKLIKKTVEVKTYVAKDIPVYEVELDETLVGKTMVEQFEYLRNVMKGVAQAHVEAGLATSVDRLIGMVEDCQNPAVEWYSSSQDCL